MIINKRLLLADLTEDEASELEIVGNFLMQHHVLPEPKPVWFGEWLSISGIRPWHYHAIHSLLPLKIYHSLAEHYKQFATNNSGHLAL